MRVFIALIPDNTTTTALEALQSSLSLKKEDVLLPLEKLHTTLHFCGDLDEGHVTEMITMMIESPSHSKITLITKNLSFFGHEHSKRLVVTLNETEELNTLFTHCLQSMDEKKIPCETHKEYKPHITLAKIKSGITLPKLQKSITVTFSSIVLFETVRANNESTYRPLASINLK